MAHLDKASYRRAADAAFHLGSHYAIYCSHAALLVRRMTNSAAEGDEAEEATLLDASAVLRSWQDQGFHP